MYSMRDSAIDPKPGAAIMISVFIVVFVTASNDYQKERQFQALQAKQDMQRIADVIRDGRQITINCTELVARARSQTASLLTDANIQVGDVFQFSPGTIIPADGILVRPWHAIAFVSAADSRF